MCYSWRRNQGFVKERDGGMDYKKLVGPIIVTLVLLAYFIFFIVGAIQISEIPCFKIWGIGLPIIFIGYSIWALGDRIKEIRSGEEDDLSKY